MTRKKILSSLFGCRGWLCLVWMMPAFSVAVAQSFSDSLEVYALDVVEVTANPHADDIIPAKTLDGQLLQQMQSKSVADAIRFFSGVQIKDYGGIGGLKTVNIRSMGSQHLGVFYDGIQLGNAQNGQVDLGRFSLDNMEAIQLYHGQRNSVLQSAKEFGSAGTIYLQSKVPVFEGDRRSHVRAGVSMGSFGLINPSLCWQQKIASSSYAVLSGEYQQAHGRYPFRYRKMNADGSLAYDTTAIRQNADIEAFRGEAFLGGALDQGEWKAQVYHYQSQRGLPGYVARNLYAHSQRQWDRNTFVQMRFRKDFNNGYSLLLNGKYADDFTRYLNPDTTLQYIDASYHQQEYYLSCANAFRPTETLELSLSVDGQHNRLESNLSNFAYPRRTTLLVAGAMAGRWPKLQCQLSLLGSFVWEEARQQPSPFRKVFSPSLSVAYQPFDESLLSLRGFYKRAFRLPTFNDLYYTFVGNAFLKPEFATQYDMGVDYRPSIRLEALEALQLSVDAYYNKVDDKIVAVPSSNPFRWQMMNLGKVRILGTDVSCQAAWEPIHTVHVQTRVNYSFQQAIDVTDPNDFYYRHQIPYVPWHSASLVADASWKAWQLLYSFIYTGERYDQSANIPANYVQPWYTHDLSLAYAFRFCECDWRWSVEVNNLLNQQYDVVLNYPMPGTNFRLSLKVSW